MGGGRRVELSSNADLIISKGGSYFFENLHLNAESNIEIYTDEKVSIYIKDNLYIGDRCEIEFSQGPPSKLFFGVDRGDVIIGSDALFKGTVVAPKGKIEIFGQPYTNIYGQFIANDVIVHQYKNVVLVPYNHYNNDEIDEYAEEIVDAQLDDHRYRMNIIDITNHFDYTSYESNLPFVADGYSYVVAPNPVSQNLNFKVNYKTNSSEGIVRFYLVTPQKFVKYSIEVDASASQRTVNLNEMKNNMITGNTYFIVMTHNNRVVGVDKVYKSY